MKTHYGGLCAEFESAIILNKSLSLKQYAVMSQLYNEGALWWVMRRILECHNPKHMLESEKTLCPPVSQITVFLLLNPVT